MHIGVSPEWMMVIITAIYVCATVLILIANNKSVKIAQEQFEEMRREYEEHNRPIIEIELDLKQRIMYALKFINRGTKTANHVKIILDNDFLCSIKGFNGAYQLKEQMGKECIIGVGQCYELFLFDVDQKANEELLPISGTVIYEADGKKYTAEYSIDIKNYMTFFSKETEEEKLRKLIAKQNTEICRLNKTIATIADTQKS